MAEPAKIPVQIASSQVSDPSEGPPTPWWAYVLANPITVIAGAGVAAVATSIALERRYGRKRG